MAAHDGVPVNRIPDNLVFVIVTLPGFEPMIMINTTGTVVVVTTFHVPLINWLRVCVVVRGVGRSLILNGMLPWRREFGCPLEVPLGL